MNAPLTRSCLLLLACFLFAGCTTVRHKFADADPQYVWTALKAVAESPEYDDADYSKRWTIEENNVAVFEDERRIEIHRSVRRVLHRPGSSPVSQSRTWKFRVIFRPPNAKFTIRNAAVPDHARREADRYFDDVQRLLSGIIPGIDALPPKPVHLPEPPPDQPNTQPDENDEKSIIDIEELEPM